MQTSSSGTHAPPTLSLLLFALDVATGPTRRSDEVDVLLAAHTSPLPLSEQQSSSQQQQWQLRSRLQYAAASCVAEVERGCVALSRCSRASLSRAPCSAWRCSHSHILCDTNNNYEDNKDDNSSTSSNTSTHMCCVYPVEDGRYMATVTVSHAAWQLMCAAVVAYLLHVAVQGCPVALSMNAATAAAAAADTTTDVSRHYTPLHTRLRSCGNAVQMRMQRKVEQATRALAHVHEQQQQQQQRRDDGEATHDMDTDDTDMIIIGNDSDSAAAVLQRLCVMWPSSLSVCAATRAQLHDCVRHLVYSADDSDVDTVATVTRYKNSSSSSKDAPRRYVVSASALWHSGQPMYYNIESEFAAHVRADAEACDSSNTSVLYDDYLLPAALDCVIASVGAHDSTTYTQQQQEQQQQSVLVQTCIAMPSPRRHVRNSRSNKNNNDNDDGDRDTGVLCMAVYDVTTTWLLSLLLVPQPPSHNADGYDVSTATRAAVAPYDLLTACAYDAHTRRGGVSVTLPQVLARAHDVLQRRLRTLQLRELPPSTSSSAAMQQQRRCHGAHVIDDITARLQGDENGSSKSSSRVRRVLRMLSYVYMWRRCAAYNTNNNNSSSSIGRSGDVLLLHYTTVASNDTRRKRAAARLLSACAPRIAQLLQTCTHTARPHRNGEEQQQQPVHQHEDGVFALLQSSQCEGVCVCHAMPLAPPSLSSRGSRAVLYVLLLLLPSLPPPPSPSAADKQRQRRHRRGKATTQQRHALHKHKRRGDGSSSRRGSGCITGNCTASADAAAEDDDEAAAADDDGSDSVASVLYAASALRAVTSWLLHKQREGQ